ISGGMQGYEELAERAKRDAFAESATEAAVLLRDIFGPHPLPLRPLEPSLLQWKDGCLVTTARRIYEKREFQFLPLLADLLQEAGCTDGELLNHCRAPAVHVKGCWVVDLVLGKS